MIREAGEVSGEEEQELKNVAAMGYAAGSDSVRLYECPIYMPARN